MGWAVEIHGPVSSRGFFVLSRAIFDYMAPGEKLVEAPFQRLIGEGKLYAYKYEGCWAAIDTFKEVRRHACPRVHPLAALEERLTLKADTGNLKRLSGMLKTLLTKGKGGLQSILCLGAHCDDIEIGCGGSVLRLLEEHAGTSVAWIVFSANDAREREARESAEVFLKSAADQTILVKRFRDGFFPANVSDIKEFFEELKQDISPNLIFSHYGRDLHQDHRIISELTWNTFRDHMILEYEIPKYDGGLGSPNLFVTLEDRHLQLKVQTLLDRFASQRRHLWFSPETFNGLARLRGIECNAPSGFAEAFYCRKTVF